MSNLIYDEYYTVTLSNNNYTFSNARGAFSGNGKLALYNSMSKIGTDQLLVSVGDINHDQIGKYRNNVVEGFAMNEVRLFNPIDSNISYTLQSQTLNMLTGSCSSIFQVRSNNVSPVTIQNDITPLRQLPYCVLQTMTVTPNSNFQYLDVHHMFQSNSNISSPEYNNNTFFNEKIYANNALYIMNAQGTHIDTKSKVACASCYFNNSNVLGFNVTNKKGGCYQQFRYNNALQDSPFTINALTITMSSKDFPEPLEEIKRILMNIAFKNSDTDILISQIQAESGNEWYKLWGCDIELRAKETLSTTSAEYLRVVRLRRYIRQSLFNILCCVREGVNSEVNPLSLSYIDTNGNLFYDGDIWLIPALLLLRPNIARTFLEFRYKGLEQAMQLAASYGYKGSKYPYENDIIGYKNVYWDVASPLHIFNNAVIAINTWNYFRLTNDREWLLNKGYVIMKNIADFIIGTLDNTFTMYNVVGLGGRVSIDHGFTKYVAKLALKYTIEASYELNYAPKASWLNAYLNLDVLYYSGASYDVVRYDSTYTRESSLNILDTLLILLPYYSTIYFNNTGRDYTSILRNLLFYINSISSDFQSNPINLMIIASLYGLISQSDTSYLSTFYDSIDAVITAVGQKDYWGNFMINTANGVDLTLNGFFVFMFLNVIGGLKIKGGITEGKFYYEAYGVQGPYTINMPNTWRSIIFSAIGNNEELYNVINNIQLA